MSVAGVVIGPCVDDGDEGMGAVEEVGRVALVLQPGSVIEVVFAVGGGIIPGLRAQ